MKCKLMLIYLDETQSAGGIPLYEAVVRRLLKLEIRGASVHIGEMGFGSHHLVHHRGLFGISDDRPVLITVVEDEQKLLSVLPEIRHMVQDGMIVLLDGEVL